LAEIANLLEINKKELARIYRFLVRELDFIAAVPDPIKSICKIANKLGLKEKTKRKAIDLLEKTRPTEIFEGKNPEIIAATVVYAACILSAENKSQNEIATVAGTSVVSIRKRFLDMKKNIDLSD
jgi:transcription initiation factor TFIIB